MKIKESELRGIIEECVKNYLTEALNPDVARNAQRYIKQNSNGGFTTNQNYNGLGGLLAQRMGAKKDSNGQMDWQNSADEITGLIGKYQNEVRRLTRVYNAITGRQSQTMGADSLAKRRENAAAKQRWMAIQKSNGSDYSNVGAKYGNVAQGNSDVSKHDSAIKSLRNVNRPTLPGKDWIHEEVEEGFLGNLFKKNNGADEVEQICANWKQYVGNSDAAKKIQDRIAEYKGTIQQLRGIISKGVKGGHIKDMNAQKRAEMNAAKKNGWQTPGLSRQALEEAVGRALRKVLSESI